MHTYPQTYYITTYVRLLSTKRSHETSSVCQLNFVVFHYPFYKDVLSRFSLWKQIICLLFFFFLYININSSENSWIRRKEVKFSFSLVCWRYMCCWGKRTDDIKGAWNLVFNKIKKNPKASCKRNATAICLLSGNFSKHYTAKQNTKSFF